jgi:hypothetical protein
MIEISKLKDTICIGARVKCISKVDGNGQVLGAEGVIIATVSRKGEKTFLVEFLDYIGGHDGLFYTDNPEEGCRGKAGHCWWCHKEDLEVIR